MSIIALLFASCSKDKQTLTKNVWGVENFKVHTDSALQYQTEYINIAVTYLFQMKMNMSLRKKLTTVKVK